jgi:hypothetical protein
MENHTAKHFVLQLGSLISLYLSLSFLLVLLFGLVNIIFPDAGDEVWMVEQASSSIRLGIAMVIVFFPTYLTLTRLVNKSRRKEKNHSYLSLTKWLIYLSLLVGGIALLIDLVIVIMTFLEGDITQRFILKAFSVIVVVGAAFHYYLLDSKGYWIKKEQTSIMYAIGATIVVCVALAFGFANIEAPAGVREQKIDQGQVIDLQNIQWQVQDYLAINSKLPSSLDELAGVESLPKAPEGRPEYKYSLVERGFSLCATFNTESRSDEYMYTGSMPLEKGDVPMIVNPDNWQHGTGEVCFERVVK